MQGKKNNSMVKRIVDVCMTVLLLCLMAYQVTGEQAHEWIGMGMTVLVIIHQFLNRRWYGAVFKGRYTAYRALSAAVNLLLLLSFMLTAFSGMSMSGYAVPFMYGLTDVALARKIHLSMSHWSFVLMGLHLGLHVPVMAVKWKLSDRTKSLISILFCGIAGIGLFLFLRNRMQDYLFFRVQFAFLDYEKPAAWVFMENILMILFLGVAGAQAAVLCRKTYGKDSEKKNPLLPAVFVMAAVILGLVLNMVFPAGNGQGFGSAGWSAPQENDTAKEDITEAAEERDKQAAKTAGEQNPDMSEQQDPAEVEDGFLLIEGGTFLMGSPESENWRIDDETQHEVTVSSFYADAYETKQEEYERLMGSNPSSFTGEKLPVDNISWLDAIAFANAKSKDAGLTPVYTVTAEGVSWDTAANGYRLPTEAEWEYACRAATTTPFNTEKSPDEISDWLDANGINR